MKAQTIQRKAQTNQMFNYIMVLIVMALILGMGFYLIPKIPREACKYEFENFKNTIVNDIENEADNDDGINHEYFICGDYQQICFKNSQGDVVAGVDSRIRAEIEAGTRSNVFLLGKDYKSFEANADIRIPGSNNVAKCFPIVNNRAYLFFEGRNRFLLISSELQEEDVGGAFSLNEDTCFCPDFNKNDKLDIGESTIMRFAVEQLVRKGFINRAAGDAYNLACIDYFDGQHEDELIDVCAPYKNQDCDVPQDFLISNINVFEQYIAYVQEGNIEKADFNGDNKLQLDDLYCLAKAILPLLN